MATGRRSRRTLVDPCKRAVGPRRLLYVMTLPCHMQGGRRPSGRGFVRNRVHRAAGEGVPGVAEVNKIRCPQDIGLRAKNIYQSTILPVNRCPADTLTCIATDNPGTPAPVASVYPVTSKSASCRTPPLTAPPAGNGYIFRRGAREGRFIVGNISSRSTWHVWAHLRLSLKGS